MKTIELIIIILSLTLLTGFICSNVFYNIGYDNGVKDGSNVTSTILISGCLELCECPSESIIDEDIILFYNPEDVIQKDGEVNHGN